MTSDQQKEIQEKQARDLAAAQEYTKRWIEKMTGKSQEWKENRDAQESMEH